MKVISIIKKLKSVGLGFSLFGVSTISALADTTSSSPANLKTLLTHIQGSVKTGEEILLVCCTIIGLWLICTSLLHFKSHAEQGYQSEHTKKATIKMVVGVGLLALPFLTKVVLSSVGSPNNGQGIVEYSDAWQGSTTN